MAENKEVIVTIDKAFLDCPYFHYLDNSEKRKILDRLKCGQSIVCGFFVNNSLVFCAVLDFEPESLSLHVREVGGVMDRSVFGVIDSYKALNFFCEGLAKTLGYDNISFNADRPFYKKVHSSFGYLPINEKEYERRLH